MVQLTAPGQLLVILCDGSPRGEDAEELHRQRQRPAPLPAVTVLSPKVSLQLFTEIHMYDYLILSKKRLSSNPGKFSGGWQRPAPLPAVTLHSCKGYGL